MKKILDVTIIGANITNRSEFNLIWPNQLQPKLKYWTKWIKKIKQRYCIPNSLQLNEQFILGKWILPPYKLTQKDQLIFSPRLLEAYTNLKTCSCKKIDQSKFFNCKRTNQPTSSSPKWFISSINTKWQIHIINRISTRII